MITGETSITITLILALVTLSCTLFNTFHGKSKDDEESIEQRIQEATDRAKEMTKINVKLDNISADIRMTREDNAGIKKDLQDMHTKLAVLEASVRSAHKRMDGAGIGKAE